MSAAVGRDITFGSSHGDLRVRHPPQVKVLPEGLKNEAAISVRSLPTGVLRTLGGEALTVSEDVPPDQVVATTMIVRALLRRQL